MDPSTLLDYALFQLTPTRTRCDLVIFNGSKSEKLASGLFEPFLSHLKFVKDQISKGGYSIKLCPPAKNAPWFTKGTFERFVRFVSTPAVLERFVNLENEIMQIESSVQANEVQNSAIGGQLEDGSGSSANVLTTRSSDSSKLKSELEGSDDSTLEQNSKIQLQRLLETRKALLRKEQAMAYARGLVTGFEVDNIDDLISFADVFEASRLREACINFKELCKKKHGDGLWMQELAAMQACPPPELAFLGTSGIVLTNDLMDASRSDSTGSTESKKDGNSTTANQVSPTNAQVPMPWPNHMPQYMYNFQGYPFQGYPFPTMQPIPPDYSGHIQWPPGMRETKSAKREKYKNRKGTESSREDGASESSGSEEESDSDSEQEDEEIHARDAPRRKKNRKKSSKTLVIRNINYITPERRNRDKVGSSDESSSDEDEFIDEDSLKQKLDDAVGSLGKLHKLNKRNHGKKGSHMGNHIVNGSDSTNDFDDDSAANESKGRKTNDNWDAFQSLLMRDEENTVDALEKVQLDVQDDHFKIQRRGDEISSGIDPSMDVALQKGPKQLVSAGDSFVVNKRDVGLEDRVRLEDMENQENFRQIVKRRDSADEELVMVRRMEESGSGNVSILSSSATESPTIRSGKGEDWMLVDQLGKAEDHGATGRQTIFSDDYMLPSADHSSTADNNKKDVLIDDSFIIDARPVMYDVPDSPWRTDMSMAADLTLSSQVGNGNGQDFHEVLDAYEANDLCVVLERDSGLESVRESWSTDHGMDISFMETDRKSSIASSEHAETVTKKTETNGKKVPVKEVRSNGLRGTFGRSKTDMMSKVKKPSPPVSRSALQKSKLEKEEEMRRKMEELVIQRQKRIAERTAATKKVPLDNKSAKGSTNLEKNRSHAKK